MREHPIFLNRSGSLDSMPRSHIRLFAVLALMLLAALAGPVFAADSPPASKSEPAKAKEESKEPKEESLC